ncbi:hypothetical protein DYY67_0161 [Candidatus Nitrosotalea sp. TS]|nr:hypothetical protein [Candidatus Nitrosotalea sp. TS]
MLQFNMLISYASSQITWQKPKQNQKQNQKPQRNLRDKIKVT